MNYNLHRNGWVTAVFTLLLSSSLFSQFTFECPPDISQWTVEHNIQLIQGSIGNDILDFSDNNCVNATSNEPYFYTILPITVEQEDDYFFELDGVSEHRVLALYSNQFDPTHHCYSLISSGKILDADNGIESFSPSNDTRILNAHLLPNHTYFLLIGDTEASGSFQLAAYGFGGGLLTAYPATPGNIQFDLSFLDFYDYPISGTLTYGWDQSGNTISGSISDTEDYERLQLTGLPILHSDCDINTTSCYNTINQTGDCNNHTITRHFDITACSQDEVMTAGCAQDISFRLLSLDDIFFPNKYIELDCSTGYPLDENNQPHPSYTGYPFFLYNGGMAPLMEVQANIASIYQDQVQTADFVIREWHITNWCMPGNTIQFDQYFYLNTENNIVSNCPDDTSLANVEKHVQTLPTPALNADHLLSATDQTCLTENAGNYYYSTYSFTVEQETSLILEMNGASSEGVFALYENAFSGDDNCHNLIQIGRIISQDIGYFSGTGNQQIVARLKPNITYSILVADTGFSTIETIAYSIAGGTINGLPAQAGPINMTLLLGDEDLLYLPEQLEFSLDHDGNIMDNSISAAQLYRLKLTGIPEIISDYGATGFMITDALGTYNCNTYQINRHFNILLNSDNQCNTATQVTFCDQTINILPPENENIIAPPLHVNLRCIDFSQLDEFGRPIPTAEEYPFVSTIFGPKSLSFGYLNLTASFENETISSGVWLRHWVVTSNCPSGVFLTFDQEITLMPNADLTLNCPDDRSNISLDKTIQPLNMEVSAGVNEIDFTDSNCMPTALQNTYSTNLMEMSVNQSDLYIFETDGLSNNDFLAVYEEAVSTDNPCNHILAVAKSMPSNTGYFTASTTAKRMGIWLEAGQTYYLLAAAQSTTDFSIAIHSQNGGLIDGLPTADASVIYTLKAWDVDYLRFDEPQTYQVDNHGNIINNSLIDDARFILNKTGYPTINSQYGNYQVTISDSIISGEQCDDLIIDRTIEVELIPIESCLEVPTSISCHQYIHFEQSHVEDIFWPTITPLVSCEQFFESNETGLPTTSVTGYPFLLSAFRKIEINDLYTGNLLVNTSDFEVTPHNFRRQWTIINGCSITESINFNQMVTIENQAPPMLNCPETDHPSGILHYPLNTDECTANIDIPVPEFPASCPSFANMEIEVIQILDDNTETSIGSYSNVANPTIEGLEPGYYYFRYTATDDAGNVSTMECPFITQEIAAPIANCDNHLNINIGGGGNARIYSIDVDNASYDACSNTAISIRRNDDLEWRSYLDFDCSFVGVPTTIYLRVWDDGNGSGLFGDSILYTYPNGYSELVGDNYAICEVTVTIVDMLAPYCLPPHDISLFCTDELLNNMDTWGEAFLNETFGMAIADDNCEGAARQTSISFNLNDCGYGNITRRFNAEDSWGNTSSNTCRQVITVQEAHDFFIKFPKDETVPCLGAPQSTAIAEGIGCDDFTITYEDLPGDDQGCVIERTYSVINTCSYDGTSPPVVIGRDEDCDEDPGDEDVYVIVKPNTDNHPISYTTYIDRDTNPFNNNPLRKTNRCDETLPVNPGGHWANSELSPEISSNGYFQYTQFLNLSGSQPPTITYDGAQNVLCMDSDPCGISTLPYFTVTPYCPVVPADIHVYFDKDSDGSIDAEAIIFDTNIQPDGTIEVIYLPNVTVPGLYRVSVSATDHCGNEGTFVFITEVLNCNETHLGGNIQTVSGDAISGVPVSITGSTSMVTLTNTSGHYEFCTIPTGSSITLAPSVELDIHDGVTALDIIAIAKHILGSEVMTNPYNLIAADVNNSGSISTLDIIGIQRVILGMAETFDNNTAWRLVLSDYVFGPNPLQENFPEMVIFENFDANIDDVDFIAIKIGDVNGSLVPFQRRKKEGSINR